MNPSEIILPFALPPAEHAKDLLKLLTAECGLTGLAMLLSRHHSLKYQRYDDFARELPHERWLAQRHHWQSLTQQKNKLALPLSDGYWFLVNPVHLHIASNHLVLTDYRQVTLSDHDARHLFDQAKTYCDEAGVELIYGDAAHWFLRADDWSDLITATPDAACGHNIEIWLPQGQASRAWRKLHNDIQMAWFIHPVQEQRQQRGEKVVNGLWLWSGTLLQRNLDLDTRSVISAALSENPASFQSVHTARTTGSADASPSILIDLLIPAALANDWDSWLKMMIELEHAWFQPLCIALKKRNLQQVHLVLSNHNTLINVRSTSNSLRKFWRKTHFNYLIN
jgi:hypothetical protein